jgi:hypothetical protein
MDNDMRFSADGVWTVIVLGNIDPLEQVIWRRGWLRS